MMITGNYYDFFHGAYNGIPQWCFCEQTRNWPKEVQTCHGV
jgi:hypothetical protein